jgi:hypothetical protein
VHLSIEERNSDLLLLLLFLRQVKDGYVLDARLSDVAEQKCPIDLERHIHGRLRTSTCFYASFPSNDGDEVRPLDSERCSHSNKGWREMTAQEATVLRQRTSTAVDTMLLGSTAEGISEERL